MNTAYPRHPAAQSPSLPASVQPGAGTRLTVNALGHSTGAPPRGQTFNHPFRPFLGSASLTFRLGTVQSLAGIGPIEPKIKVNGQLVPMSEKDGNTPAALFLGGLTPNADGISYAALEVTPDEKTGELTKDSRVEIVHTITPVSLLPNLGRGAIALILWSKGNPLASTRSSISICRYLRILRHGERRDRVPKHPIPMRVPGARSHLTRYRPRAGMGMPMTAIRLGETIANAPARKWKHPGFTRAVWNALASRWVATVQPRFV